MPTAIDGSNLGGVLDGRRGSRDRHEVLRRLLPWARKRRRAVLVFDGPEDPDLAHHYGSLQLLWSGGSQADEVVLRLVRAKPHDWTVVTDDRALAAACLALGARHRRVEDFLARLPAEEQAATEPTVDVQEWENWFRRGGPSGD